MKVFIPTAGTGSRLGNMTKYLNKSLISIAGRPALSRIIEMFPIDTEFVIAIGYKGNTVKEFIELAYPERKIKLIEVSPYEGEGSGLGLTLLTAKEYLREPFIFCSCDTLVTEPIPFLSCNWMGYGERAENASYRTICFDAAHTVTHILEKCEKREGQKPYIGLCGIYDWQIFWETMERGGGEAIRCGEAYGLQAVLENAPVQARHFTWFDTGIEKELELTRNYYRHPDEPNILEKANETIWFMDSAVIKYSDNTKFIADRVKRAKLLGEYVPKVTAATEHMYRYDYADGEVLSKCVNLPIFAKLLDYSNKFWQQAEPNEACKEKFHEDCMKFYRDKTYERVALFYKNFGKEDKPYKINGVAMPTLQEMLDKLDWDWFAEGRMGQFHGDYHFENILYNKASGKFTFLDWRQNFGDSLDVGDVYYDLGKLLHGIIDCHDLITKDLYQVDWAESEIYFDLNRKQILVECENYFYGWLEENGFDVLKVKVMTALIYLNIAALHHHPYSLMLYGLGKWMLYQEWYKKRKA